MRTEERRVLETAVVEQGKPNGGTLEPAARTWLITGGPGPEREGSLLSGCDVADALCELGVQHEVVDLVTIADAAIRRGDVAFLTTHGQWGEDGKLPGYLETLKVSYTGASVLGAAVSMHKAACNRAAGALGLHVPAWLRVTSATSAADVRGFVEAHGPRVILRPASGGGSRGIVVGESADEMLAALGASTWEHVDFLLSRFIVGTEVSAACIATSDHLEHLPILQTDYEGDIYDYRTKHDAALRRHHCPAPLSDKTAQSIKSACASLYRALGLSGFARFDFLVSADGVPWFLEVNALPGMSRNGNLATMAAAAGMSYSGMVFRQLQSARGIDRYRS